MIFSTVEFFVFLAAVLAVMTSLRGENARRNLLLLASYVFYGWWDWRFCFLILASTLIDYVVGIRLEESRDPARRKRWLVLSLAANLGFLGFFKYTNFFLDTLRPLLDSAGLHVPHLGIILPVGISFFTFQTMSYSIDVYRGTLPATRSFRDFALFVAFFPQLVAGPIVRGSEFLPQLRNDKHPLRLDNLRRGTEIFVRGFTKKVLFADTLAFYVDPVFGDPAMYSPWVCWVAVIAYAAQIYYDFSGYSEMAIGVGRMFGFTLPVNFRHPYVATSITEFWRRWHISLSSWLRDYLYVPLGGNRKGRVFTYRNLVITMVLGGLWHGAAWTFVIWGSLHAVALALHKLFLEIRAGKPRAEHPLPRRILSWAVTFVFVLVTWVVFRAPDLPTAWIYLRKMAFLDGGGAEWFYIHAMVALALGAVGHVVVLLRGERDLTLDLRRPVAWVGLAFLGLLILLFAPIGSNPFIYFQF